MKVQCPHCGKPVEVNGLGRKALNIPVINVCDVIQLRRSVTEAAKELGCSRGYIYKVLKVAGLRPAEVVKGLATKDTRLLHNEGLNDGR